MKSPGLMKAPSLRDYVKGKKSKAKAKGPGMVRHSSFNSMTSSNLDTGFIDSDLNRAIQAHKKFASSIIMQQRSSKVPDKFSVPMYRPDELKGALFCGHTVTDLDSIAGAIGAAYLYGGTAVRASEINSETAHAMKVWGFDDLPTVEREMELNPERSVCIVDYNQTTQMNPAIPPKQIVGVIDHHALQNQTLQTSYPIFMDVRPWGSMSTIITHSFIRHRVHLPTRIAGILLSAILSDTLNLCSPTTTEWDKKMVAVLCTVCKVLDVDEMASAQFKAKSAELNNLSSHALCVGDMKVFSYEGDGFTGKVGFGVVETADTNGLFERKDDLLTEMKNIKYDRELNLFFLAIINIVELKSQVLLCGDGEKSLGAVAFPPGKNQLDRAEFKAAFGTVDAGKKEVADFVRKHDLEFDVEAAAAKWGGDKVGVAELEDLLQASGCFEPMVGAFMYTGGRVSRKKDFIPAISNSMEAGWNMPAKALLEIQMMDPPQPLIAPTGSDGYVVRTPRARLGRSESTDMS